MNTLNNPLRKQGDLGRKHTKYKFSIPSGLWLAAIVVQMRFGAFWQVSHEKRLKICTGMD